MNTVETVLIVLLAVGFLILLALSIALVVIIMSILKNVKKISQKAEETTASFADLSMMVGKRVAPVALSAAMAAAMRRFKSKKE